MTRVLADVEIVQAELFGERIDVVEGQESLGLDAVASDGPPEADAADNELIREEG